MNPKILLLIFGYNTLAGSLKAQVREKAKSANYTMYVFNWQVRCVESDAVLFELSDLVKY